MIEYITVYLAQTIVEKMGYYIEYIKIRKYIPLYLIIPIIISQIYGSNPIYVQVQLYYGICTLLVTFLDGNEYYLLLGLSLSAFLSEYWEIPIFVYKFLNNRMTYTSVLIVMYRLPIIVFATSYMKKLKINYKGYLYYMFVFLIVYSSFVLDALYKHRPLNGWLMRLSCFAISYTYLFYETRLKYMFNNNSE